jgi:4-oxalocrotonate tautomerase
MPIVHVHIWEGMDKKKVTTIIRRITDVFVEVGIPEHAVEVLIHEVPKSHWGIGGGPASEKLKE